jgi:hypothetical protein
MKPPECRGQAWARSEADIHKASFIERRLFFLSGQRHCEEDASPSEAISLAAWRLLRATSALAMTIYKGMK